MNIYLNLSGNSPIQYYQIETDRILVSFKGGRTYSYSYSKAGIQHVETMKQLAMQGKGLSAYITRNVRFKYD
jgi:hypothetical protein